MHQQGNGMIGMESLRQQIGVKISLANQINATKLRVPSACCLLKLENFLIRAKNFRN
jgi:hypothetical protein